MFIEKYLCLATLASDLISLFPSNGFVPEISLGLSIRVLTRRGKTSLLHNTVTHCFIIAIAAISSSDEINCRCWRCLTRFLTVSSCFFPKKKSWVFYLVFEHQCIIKRSCYWSLTISDSITQAFFHFAIKFSFSTLKKGKKMKMCWFTRWASWCT